MSAHINHMSRRIVVAAVAGAALAAVTATPAQAAAEPKAELGLQCVLKSGGGANCEPNASKGPAVAKLFQHPNYEGYYIRLHLPKGKTKCTSSYDNEYSWDIWHGTFFDNITSSVDTRFSTASRNAKCDVKLYDGHHLDPDFGKGATVWIDRHNRLSQLGNGFDNRASSMRVS